MTVEVIDFGCRLNIAEGASIARALADADDTIVINSCAVTSEAVRQARQAIRRAARRRPEARIIVTGCGVASDGPAFAAMPEVASVIAKDTLRDARPALTAHGHARAFVEVQNGCDHDCTFCVTTLARGESRSLDAAAIIEAIVERVAQGQREVVLTGVDLTSYRPSLAILVAAILREVPELPRLRLSSLDPAEVDNALFDLIAYEPRVMPHVHLSLQSGDAMILKRMKRRHSPEQAMALVERLKAARPEIAIGADLIAGFPTESAAMHENSLAILDTCDIVLAHVFPYSPRPGTAAARMPQVAGEVAKARARVLRDHAEARKQAWLLSLVGSRQDVLIEADGLSGHAPNFAAVTFEVAQPRGRIVGMQITGVANGRLQARVA
jgi:threonylcarbamoyladenosine tRNA methylthiotransferase MtaB